VEGPAVPVDVVVGADDEPGGRERLDLIGLERGGFDASAAIVELREAPSPLPVSFTITKSGWKPTVIARLSVASPV
jgi:hypothetical protein